MPACDAGEEAAEGLTGQGGKARTEAATACLTGMRALMSAQNREPQADGTLIIAEGPSASAPGAATT